MHIAIGSDHAGYRLKEHFKGVLKEDGHTVDDLGTHSEEPVDYPPICAAVARARGIRAALCNDLYTARVSREHNDANVLAMGGRVVGEGLADEILRLWLSTGFEGGRHERRVKQITDIERGES